MMKSKKLHLEALRIIAIYFVILTHTGTRGFTHFTVMAPSVKYFIAMCVPVWCNICVPLFYMISGATMLSKDETPGQIWRRRIPKYVAVLVLATLLMYGYYGLKDGTAMSVGDFLKTLYSKNVIVPYWYLYSYLGFLILLPMLRKLIRNLSDKELRYMMLVYLAFNGLIPMAQYWLSGGSVWINPSLNVALVTSNIVIYPAAGYYFEHRAQTGKKQLIILWVLTALAVAATVAMTHYKLELTGQRSESQVGTFYKSLCLIPSVTVYATVKALLARLTPPKWLEKAILSVGSCTFGIYLIEQIVRERGYGIWEFLVNYMPRLLATGIYVILVGTFCYGIVWVAKRIPVIKKLI